MTLAIAVAAIVAFPFLAWSWYRRDTDDDAWAVLSTAGWLALAGMAAVLVFVLR